ncbi:MAG: hypothetical protein II303_06000, partial [Alistipes sp.]|nr:hypothetical protein [Alistipes sp.]
AVKGLQLEKGIDLERKIGKTDFGHNILVWIFQEKAEGGYLPQETLRRGRMLFGKTTGKLPKK